MAKKNVRFKPRGRSVEPSATEAVRAAIAGMPLRRDLLIEYLHKLQDGYGALFADHVVALADLLKLTPVEVYEVATFYHHFDVVKEGDPAPAALTVRVCDSVTCELFGAEALVKQLSALAQNDVGVRIQRVPCVGRCDAAPVAVVGTTPVPHATVDAVKNVVHQSTHQPINPLTDSLPNAIRYEQYVAEGGYELLRQVRNGEISHEQVISALEGGGLRGLGGAGFNAGRKWRIVGSQPGPRNMCVNIDEGEPGTFKDRVILETDPHRMFEGALIAAHIVGCDAIYFYLRDEYADVRALLEEELEKVKIGIGDWGLGIEHKSANQPINLPTLELRRGAGAYICGEESAMIESIEGKRGLPRLRPPYVAEVGLFGRPTLVHNCETVWWVRDIVQKGAAWFASHGRNGRKGLRRFSVSGRVQQPGVKLSPAGISLLELIDEYCGGMLPGHELYAYFPGGASGGLLPASLANVPLDFDTLQPHGSFIGSAAVIVLSQHDSARAAALNAMRFFRHESCGQCTPCRVGTAKSAELMEVPAWDVPLLNDVAQVMTDASICGLGQAAANPMKSVIKYFSHEVAQ